MSDWLKMHNITTECRLGVQDWEKEKPQPIWIDIELIVDVRKAAAQDAVADAVDYAGLVAAAKSVAAEKPYNLLETLAERLAAAVLGKVKTTRLVIKVKKKALADVEFAAVEIERSNVQPPQQPPMRRHEMHPQRRDNTMQRSGQFQRGNPMQRGNSMQRGSSMPRRDSLQRSDQPRREFRRFDRSAPPRR